MSQPEENITVPTLKQTRSGERGYTLVALLAVMTIMAVIMLAVAPSMKQQAQRENEEEAIFRGEEVAEAIRLYVRYNPTHQLPNSMEQLLEGVQVPGRSKKMQVLRPEAAHDPLSSSGEWRLVRPNTQALLQFQRAVMDYSGSKGQPPPTREPFFQQFVVQMTALGNVSKETAPGGEDDSANASGPFIGVTSRSRRNSIINYYGIDRHDQWIFTPLFR